MMAQTATFVVRAVVAVPLIACVRPVLALVFFSTGRHFLCVPCARGCRSPVSSDSVFHIHNETINVWSHFVGSLLFLGFIAHLLIHSHFFAPKLFPQHHGLVSSGVHTSALFTRHVVSDSPCTDDWEAAHHFPSVSSLHVYLKALKGSTAALGAGTSGWALAMKQTFAAQRLPIKTLPCTGSAARACVPMRR